MKSFSWLAVSCLVVGTFVGCSSNPTSNTEDEPGSGGSGGNSRAGSSATVAGTSNSSGTASTPAGGTGNAAGGSSPAQGGQSMAGSSPGGSPPASGGSGTGGSAEPGTGGQSGGSGPGGANGGAGGTGPLPPFVAACAPQKYTPSATPGAACVSTFVPELPLVASFEEEGVAPGWGIYPTVDGGTGFAPTSATPSVGGANDTTQSLACKVVNLPQGVKVQVGFGTQCQDVRTFKGISFWAKGSIDGTTQPFIVTANTLVIQLGSEKSLLGGCQGAGCAASPPDKRVSISGEWREYRIPFDCFGDGKVFDGYYTNILFNAFGANSNFAIDEVGYY
jgi:hypothetical protein